MGLPGRIAIRIDRQPGPAFQDSVCHFVRRIAMRLFKLYGSAIALACACPVLASADDVNQKPNVKVDVEVTTPASSLPVYRVHEMVGLEVRDAAGKNIGKLDDLVVELNSGEVRYAALSFGGFAGVGNKLFAIPLSALAFEHKTKERASHFILDMPAEKFKAAPGFDKDHWPDFADRNWAAEIDKYYADVKVAKKNPPKTEKARGNVGASSLVRATKVEGMAVKNDAHESLGKVEDLVIDMRHADIRYAALSFGGFLGLGDKYFAIPWNGFTVRSDSKEKEHLILHVSKDRLKNAPGFDKKHWPDVGDPRWSTEVDRHYQDELRGTTAAKEKPVK
jgi:sporulation protein YlmC with PRC-barrel domain